jgi:hypothetical protein
MGVLRDEPIVLNTLTQSSDVDGQWTTTPVVLFNGRAIIQDVKSDYQIVGDTRVYSDWAKFKVRKTPAWRDVSINNSNYAITFRKQNYKIIDVLESNDRGWITVIGQSQIPSEAL